MQAKEMNQGKKIEYAIDENNKTITFIGGKNEVIIDLETEQRDVESVVDISLDKNMKLIKGVGNWYIANVIIPAAEYGTIDTGEVNEQGDSIQEEIKLPFFIENVKLILWNLPEGYISENGGI